MERSSFSVALEKNPLIAIEVIPGHFTTSNAHSNHYLDVSALKSNVAMAREIAQVLSAPYASSTLVDTIVCMEKMEVVGAYLAQELLQDSIASVNSDGDIHVIAPVSNTNGHLVFPDSAIKWIAGKNILLLVASISSGRTVNCALDCLAYYGGRLAGISALFLSSSDRPGMKTHALFTSEDIPGYRLYPPAECELCKAGRKLDAIINSEGYTKI